MRVEVKENDWSVPTEIDLDVLLSESLRRNSPYGIDAKPKVLLFNLIELLIEKSVITLEDVCGILPNQHYTEIIRIIT